MAWVLNVFLERGLRDLKMLGLKVRGSRDEGMRNLAREDGEGQNNKDEAGSRASDYEPAFV